MFLQQRAGDRADREPDQQRNDNDVVEVAEHGDEVGDEIQRRDGVGHGEAEEKLGRAGRAGIGQDSAIEKKLRSEPLKRARSLFIEGLR